MIKKEVNNKVLCLEEHKIIGNIIIYKETDGLADKIENKVEDKIEDKALGVESSIETKELELLDMDIFGG